ncbi:MAG: hypothetical protein HQL69_19195 [Magnetococcales bacterium]|nr:hypothetical protein [Magnetococcales bacterium]
MNILPATNSSVSKAVADARPELVKPPEKPSHTAKVGADAVSKVSRVGPVPKGINVIA